MPLRTKFKANVEPREQRQTATLKHRHSAAALYAAANETRQCLFCSGLHDTGSCSDKKTTMEQKKSLLAKHGRCFRCLTHGHITRQCKRKIVCPYCKRQHVPSMCNKDPEEPKKNMYFAGASYEFAVPSNQAGDNSEGDLSDNSEGAERRTGHLAKNDDQNFSLGSGTSDENLSKKTESQPLMHSASWEGPSGISSRSNSPQEPKNFPMQPQQITDETSPQTSKIKICTSNSAEKNPLGFLLQTPSVVTRSCRFVCSLRNRRQIRGLPTTALPTTDTFWITQDYGIHGLKGPRFPKTASSGSRAHLDIFYGANTRAIRLVLDPDKSVRKRHRFVSCRRVRQTIRTDCAGTCIMAALSTSLPFISMLAPRRWGPGRCKILLRSQLHRHRPPSTCCSQLT